MKTRILTFQGLLGKMVTVATNHRTMYFTELVTKSTPVFVLILSTITSWRLQMPFTELVQLQFRLMLVKMAFIFMREVFTTIPIALGNTLVMPFLPPGMELVLKAINCLITL